MDISRRLLRKALDDGFDYVDTADALGPGVSESIIGDVVGQDESVLVATKVGMLHPAAGRWVPHGHPDYLKQQVRASLIRLRRDRIDLLFLHRIDPDFPLADQLGALQELRQEGLIGRIGVSEPREDQLDEVFALEPDLAAVQSLFNIAAPGNRAVAEAAAARGVPFVAYWPLIGRGLMAGPLSAVFAALDPFAVAAGLSARQFALAWVLRTLPDALAIVGSRSSAHLRENLAAAPTDLDSETLGAAAAAVESALGDVRFDPRNSGEDA